MTAADPHALMQVYLVPLGGTRHVLYYEPADDAPEAVDDGRGWFRGLLRQFREVLRAAEAERHMRHHDVAPPASLAGRLRQRGLRWIVERMAEQRLLWHLRGAVGVTAVMPAELSRSVASELVRAELRREADRHLRGACLHAVGLALSALTIIVPGPNLIGYFFVFTVVGHVFAWRGARRGLSDVSWTYVPSAELSALGAALALDSPTREARLHAIAGALRLRHLAAFVERLVPRTA